MAVMPTGGYQTGTAARAGRAGHRRAGGSGTGRPSSRLARVGAWWCRLSLRARWLTGAGTVLAAAGLIAGLVAAFTASPVVGERPYLSFTGCLLTDSDGISGEPAAAAWAGLQEAAAATRMQAQYLAVPSSAPETAAGAAPYLASLVTQHCGLIVAAGPAQAEAVAGYASRFRTVRFVVIGGAAPGANVTIVRGSGGSVRSQVDGLARGALAAAS